MDFIIHAPHTHTHMCEDGRRLRRIEEQKNFAIVFFSLLKKASIVFIAFDKTFNIAHFFF